MISLQSLKMDLERIYDRMLWDELFGNGQANFLTQVNSIQCTMDISTLDLVAAQGWSELQAFDGPLLATFYVFQVDPLFYANI